MWQRKGLLHVTRETSLSKPSHPLYPQKKLPTNNTEKINVYINMRK